MAINLLIAICSWRCPPPTFQKFTKLKLGLTRELARGTVSVGQRHMAPFSEKNGATWRHFPLVFCWIFCQNLLKMENMKNLKNCSWGSVLIIKIVFRIVKIGYRLKMMTLPFIRVLRYLGKSVWRATSVPKYHSIKVSNRYEEKIVPRGAKWRQPLALISGKWHRHFLFGETGNIANFANSAIWCHFGAKMAPRGAIFWRS